MYRRDQHTVIEFRDRPDSEGPHKWLKGIYINGFPVRAKAGSLNLDITEGGATEVTVTLYPDEVHFNR